MRKHTYGGAVEFKDSLLKEKDRYAKAFVGHLLRYLTSRELKPGDSLDIEQIVETAKLQDYRLKSLIREVILSDAFVKAK
jgi:DNA-binding GntR family transcriptional regulator